MVKLFEFEQNTLEWHQAKWRKIGGTLSKGLLIKTDTLLIDIIGQHLEDYEPEDDFQSSSMMHGSENEPFAMQYLEQYTGLKFKKPGLLISEENSLLCLSPDGITDCDRFAAEAKCLQRKAHTKILLENETPLDHLSQIVHYFTVNPKLEKLFFIAFRAESIKHFMAEFTPETEVNLGTKARPVFKTIKEWTEISMSEADNLKIELNQALESLKSDF